MVCGWKARPAGDLYIVTHQEVLQNFRTRPVLLDESVKSVPIYFDRQARGHSHRPLHKADTSSPSGKNPNILRISHRQPMM
ncbi:uncharacterized protein BO97DRAFT_401625 [Aspergillus homomorphus CBS 101889]|uniref:Uncharacterized protein n=1 Tax=Aspergillus homomorphus (strain CBS 101889) TaxID=1450537 RepID=A0A395HGN1_ASPHC|nr:hypothetical protein BO97DRAFT_401625 [Aspergillus homomorphus CBS 101889]RAL06633.1 hypothetical protein BO97DRAFT_401625 [Aspergillus homomorphus CBS 101889]